MKFTKKNQEIYGSIERKQYAKLMQRRYNRGKQSYYDEEDLKW